MKTKELGTLRGPVLVFGGAYSNLQALTAVQAEAARLGIPAGNVICTGDTPGYCAEPEECLDLLETWGCHAIAGNVETNLVNETDDCGCGFGDGSRCDMFARLWYNFASRHVSARNLEFMATLPDVLRFTYAGRSVVVLHGSPRNQSEFVWRSTPAEEKIDFCAAAGAEVVLAGHCGLPFAHVLAEAEDVAGGQSPSSGESRLWLNAGVIGMPANDGTPRTWYLVLDDTAGFDYAFHPLDYDHTTAKARMLDDRRLPVSYAATLTTGIWDNTEIMPPAEEKREGIALDPLQIKAEAGPTSPAASPFGDPSLAAPPFGGVGGTTSTAPASSAQNGTNGKAALPLNSLKNSTMDNQYSDPKDLRTFGKIVEWQEEMGNKFFDWYAGVTEGDTALSAREKALIALAVSHAIQCSYCIDAYTTNSLQAGADEEQMMEAVHVAAAVKAGTTLIYARQMQRQVSKVTM
ncbi:arsenosugar biosynthesis-associated peroxidase-like protein [Neolewinella lacunae]|nr:arsenosugar biosynthesis-associated peroxidase-like protein [Neolewinella lacunae]MDN3636321.1 arsenosugar biosynthesis-associated peroxidase-like protein [Neolewinella lacunae]